MAATKPLVAIVGETASGKTALAIELAKRFDGEIIAADSRTIYRGLDISTAKPTAKEQAQAPHHLIDVIELNKPFTVADFQQLANKAIDNIHSGGKLPILVGGTGLYVDAVLYDYKFSPKNAQKDPQNPRHLAADTPRQKSSLRPNTLVLGLKLSPEALDRHIKNRVEHMIEDGLLNEIKDITQTYRKKLESLQIPAIKALKPYLQGEISLDEAKNRFITLDMQLAKRQRTWFKRNPDIQWVSRPEQAFELVKSLLNKKQ